MLERISALKSRFIGRGSVGREDDSRPVSQVWEPYPGVGRALDVVTGEDGTWRVYYSTGHNEGGFFRRVVEYNGDRVTQTDLRTLISLSPIPGGSYQSPTVSGTCTGFWSKHYTVETELSIQEAAQLIKDITQDLPPDARDARAKLSALKLS